MIDENLRRKECTAAELSYQTARRKELYELLFPTTAHGGDRKSSRNNYDSNSNEPERFTLNTAKATGHGERHYKCHPARNRLLHSIISCAPRSQECDRPCARHAPP